MFQSNKTILEVSSDHKDLGGAKILTGMYIFLRSESKALRESLERGNNLTAEFTHATCFA